MFHGAKVEVSFFVGKDMRPLIIGRLSEPNNIGGVVIFVSRLLASSKYLNANEYVFYSTKERNPIRLISLIYRSSFVHFNGSNPLAMFLISTICMFFRKKLILSIHAQVGISSRFLNLLESFAIRLAHTPVVGVGSIKKASKLNHGSVIISSFIEPKVTEDVVVDEVFSSLKDKIVFCTNANSLAFDHNGDEIYGISYLVDYFSHQHDSVLIVLDTSGAYSKKFKNQLTPNIIFINRDIDFCYLLQKSNCFIRFTSTDGDSVSVMESLFLNIPVIASDCIIRHEACILCQFGNLASLDIAIKKFKNGDVQVTSVESAEKYYDALYEEVSPLNCVIE